MSSPQPRCLNPKWNENHQFLIANPDTEAFVVQIREEKTETSIGSCEIRLTEILNESSLILERGFDLVGLSSSGLSGGGVGLNGQVPKVYMRLCLKVLSLKRDENNNNRIGLRSPESSYSLQEDNSLLSSHLSMDNSLVLTPPESFCSTRVGKECESEENVSGSLEKSNSLLNRRFNLNEKLSRSTESKM